MAVSGWCKRCANVRPMTADGSCAGCGRAMVERSALDELAAMIESAFAIAGGILAEAGLIWVVVMLGAAALLWHLLLR